MGLKRTMLVGNEPFTVLDNITQLFLADVVNAIGYITNALTKQPSPFNQIEATMAWLMLQYPETFSCGFQP